MSGKNGLANLPLKQICVDLPLRWSLLCIKSVFGMLCAVMTFLLVLIFVCLTVPLMLVLVALVDFFSKSWE